MSVAGARYVVGIDLGTTHTTLAMAPLPGSEEDGRPRVEVFAVPQLATPTTLDARPLMPSCVYFAHESERALALPWDEGRRFAVGEYARARGAESPARVVASAKSWLSHTGIDRRAAVLPIGAPEDVEGSPRSRRRSVTSSTSARPGTARSQEATRRSSSPGRRSC